MISRELVRRTLQFDGPARIPRQLWYLPWAKMNYPEDLQRIQLTFPDDITFCPHVSAAISQDILDAYADDGIVYRKGNFVDEWGCNFISIQAGVIGEVKEPLVQEWDDIDKVTIPYEYLSIDREAINTFCRGTDKFVLNGGTPGSFPRPFERLQFIRGTVNAYIDLMEQPRPLFDLLEKMHDFYKQLLTVWADTEVDAVWFMDDWGAQQALLISPNLWRQVFKPMYKDYIDIAHQRGKFAFMHSDGYIVDILPDLIEIGLDAINSQLFCMGMDKLAPFKGKITFWGEIDRQWLLPFGTPEQIAAAVHQVKDTLYQNGGVIAQCEFGAGAKPENVYAVYQAWADAL